MLKLMDEFTGYDFGDYRLRKRVSRLENLASLLSIFSWHIFWLYNLSRALPSISAKKIFTDGEVKVLKISAKKLKIYFEKFNLQTAVLIIARLSGFSGRKCDGLPGMINIWRGWRKLHERLEFIEELS